MTTQTLNSWDIEDDDIRNDDNLTYDDETGLYKKIRQYSNENKELCQETLQYKLETFEVSETVKMRTQCKKFGRAKNDPPGPNPSQTFLGEECFMKYFTDETTTVEEEKKLKDQSVHCRKCNGEHFTHKCPYKEEIQTIQELTAQLEGTNVDSSQNKDDKSRPDMLLKPMTNGKYLPPHMRDSGLLTSFTDKRRADSALTIRVSNLPEAAQESDLDDLFRPFGSVSRTFLAKDKQTNTSRGFAYITFHNRNDAAKAIEGVNGFGYDHCILQVEWAKQ